MYADIVFLQCRQTSAYHSDHRHCHSFITRPIHVNSISTVRKKIGSYGNYSFKKYEICVNINNFSLFDVIT